MAPPYRSSSGADQDCRRSGVRRARTDRPQPLNRPLRLEALEDRRMLATITVGNVTDVVNGNVTSIAALAANPGGDGISLREAILAANATAGADTIQFAPSLFSGGPRTIQLTQGELFINSQLTIQGPGANLLTIVAHDPTPAAGNGSRVFRIERTVTPPVAVALSGLTLTGGDVGAADRGGDGGAVWNNQNLTLSGVVVVGSSVSGRGGGVFHQSPQTGFTTALSVVDSTIRDNRTANPNGGGGGGMFVLFGTPSITRSTIRDNTSFHGGGGMVVAGSVTLVDSVVSGNRTIKDGLNGSGGGIYATENVTLTRTTVSGNGTAGNNAHGGGIFAKTGNVTLTGSTVSGNSTKGILAHGGGIFAPGNVTLTDSTVSGNSTEGYAASDNYDFGIGGGIFAEGNVTLTGSTVSENRTLGYFGRGGGIAAGGSVTLTQSAVNGNSTAGNVGQGGGIFAGGSVTLTDSTVSGNSTTGVYSSGGGIFANGNVTLTGSTVSENDALGSLSGGGGISAAGAVTLTQSTVGGNNSADGGGGILAGSVTLTQSTVSGNSSAWRGGGGILAGNVTLTQSTVSGNSTTGEIGNGGGIWVNGNVTLIQSTVTNNRAMHVMATGGGVFQSNVAGSPAFFINGSIVAGNTASGGSPDIVKDPESTLTLVYSLIGVLPPGGSGGIVNTGALTGVVPLLAPLADNGGPTQTHLPMPGSPAINAGNPMFNPADPDGIPATNDAMPFDQRGAPYARVHGGRIDMGAVEFQPAPVSADFNSSGRVDGTDFLIWQRGLGSTGAAATRANGNANGDNVVNAADLAVWKSQFGTTGASIAAGEAELAAAVSAPPPSQGGARGGSADGGGDSMLDAGYLMLGASSLSEDSSRTVRQSLPRPLPSREGGGALSPELIDAAMAYRHWQADEAAPRRPLRPRLRAR